MEKKTAEEIATEKLKGKMDGKPERQETEITDFIKNQNDGEAAPKKKKAGRPRKEKKLQDGYKISLSFPAEWEGRIKDAAEGRGMAVTDFIRMTVAEYIK